MIGKILREYDGSHDYWFPHTENPFQYPYLSDIATHMEKIMFERWGKYIKDRWGGFRKNRWYGFSLEGLPVPVEWFLIIHEFLLYLEKEAPNFKILQIKTKFGGIKFIVELNVEDEEKLKFLNLQIEKLEYALFDEKIIF